jgi:U3 small nucleolar RNA-associated protein 25
MGKASSSSKGKGGKSKSKDKKVKSNKGPKGKKARAKAKLQRQWGEEVKDAGKDPLQPRGQDVKVAAKAAKKAASRQSRRLVQEQQEQEAAAAYANDEYHDKKKRSPHDDSDDDHAGSSSSSDTNDDDNDDDDDVSDNEKETSSAVSNFLATIQKNTQRKRQKVVGVVVQRRGRSDHDEDNENDKGSGHDDAQQEQQDSTGKNKDDDDDVAANNMDEDDVDFIMSSSSSSSNNSSVDFFLERFSQPPLPETEADLAQEMKRIQHPTVKIPISSSSSSSSSSSTIARGEKNKNNVLDYDNDGAAMMELQLSKVWVEKYGAAAAYAVDCSSSSSINNNIVWKELATRAFTGNREILKQNWTKIQKQQRGKNASVRDASGCPISVLYPLLATYTDVFYPAVPADDFSSQESSTTQQVLCLHILNHVMTTRTRIFKHNRKLKQLETAAMAAATAAEKEPATENKDDDDDDDDDDNNNNNKDTPQPQQQPDDDLSSSSWSRDQGFTRPTVLVLLPTGGTCYTFVKTLLSLLSGSTMTSTNTNTIGTVDNLERFETEYGPQDENDKEVDDNVQVANLTLEQKMRRKKVLQQKGPEWLELFADEVNDNDDFKLGIAIHPKGTTTATRKNKSASSNGDDNGQQQQQEGSCSVKLYADFYRSDIIVASPLGLKMSLAAADNAANGTGDDNDNDDNDHHDDEDNGNNRQSRNRRADFLSSIEICLLARADVMYMQNWDHVQDVLDRVNQPLENSFNVDFARVRPYHLAGQAQYWRQLILCSAWSDPLLSHTFTRHAHSVAGLARIRQRVSTTRADIAQVLVVPEIKQVFQRVATASVLTQSHDRIEYFCQHLLPRMILQEQRHTLIFVPNYLEFVSLRNRLLKQQEVTSGTTASTYCDFVAVTEYSRISETSRGRARFIQGRKAILLYTGRAHFFHRHFIKGARHLIFFGLPEYANFYSHHVNLLNDAGITTKHDKKNSNGGDSAADEDTGITLSCTVLFTKYESHALERIVGTSNCKRMVGGEKSTFFFVS